MKKILIFTAVLIFSTLAYSQKESDLSRNLFKVNILAPGLTYERVLGDKTTFNVDVNLSFGGTSKGGGQLKLLASPFGRAQYRYYYNLEKRLAKNKSIRVNSAAYIAPSISYYMKPINDGSYLSDYDGLTAGAVWGFQKTYKTGMNLGANTGLGYNFSSNLVRQVVPILNFTVAWVILK